MDKKSCSKDKPVFIKNGAELVRVQPENVVCLYSKGDYSYLVNSDSRQPVVLSRSFANLMATIFDKYLVQIRRATAININYVKKIAGNEVLLLFGIKFEMTENHIKDVARVIEVV